MKRKKQLQAKNKIEFLRFFLKRLLILIILISVVGVLDESDKNLSSLSIVENSLILSSTEIADVNESEVAVETNNTFEDESQSSVTTIGQFRLTSYYPATTSNCTGSGLCIEDFEVNENGWYTYDGKLVLAAATTYLQSSYDVIADKHYFEYYDIVTVNIDEVTYEAIILDSCGACMTIEYEERLDLFVQDSSSVIDRGYNGNNTITVALFTN